jgi:biopolymer transport protein ExbD
MRCRRAKPIQPLCGPDLTAFTCSAATVALTLLVAFMTAPTPHDGGSIDLPRVNHPTAMARAEREDALVVAIMRTGDVFFGNDKFSAGSLSDALRERLHSTRERKVYIRADARVHWATVGLVLDEVRAAGIAEVAFLADQRKEAAVPFKPPGS